MRGLELDELRYFGLLVNWTGVDSTLLLSSSSQILERKLHELDRVLIVELVEEESHHLLQLLLLNFLPFLISRKVRQLVQSGWELEIDVGF